MSVPPELPALHADPSAFSVPWTWVPDAAIGIACLGLAGALWSFARQHQDTPLRRTVVCAGGFVAALGLTQLIALATPNGPWGGAGLVRELGALLAIASAWLVVRSLRGAPVPEDLESANQSLRAEIGKRLITETELKLHASELERARDEAQAASRAKSEFLANVSHEIRTPLNAVIGLSEILLSSQLTKSQRDFLRLVHDSGNQLLNVVEDILDFSKLGAGKLRLERVDFDLEDVIGDTLRLFATRASQKHIELAYRIDDDVPHVVAGDPGRLRQVITNLVANATTFTEDGEVIVRVRRTQADPFLELQFSVEDTGAGIDPAQIERLFEAFEQVDNSPKRRHGGTGLGLSICRGIVQLLGGRIGATSTPGLGSTFFFTARFETPPSEARLDPPLPRVPVLVVDDNATHRGFLCDVLRQRGMQPVAAACAAEAYAVLEERSFEADAEIRLVVADLHMPGGDGLELVERMRSRRDFDLVQVLLLTAGEEPPARAPELRIAACLMKPVKERELAEVIGRALGRSAEQDPQQASGGGADSGAAVSREVPADAPQRRGIRPLRILLIEDSVPNQKVVLAILGAEGHRVVAAGNGREGLARFSAQPFDVVLMDIQMPAMDGLECTAAIRAIEAETGGRVPILALTAHALLSDRERCLASGMDDYLTKPIRRDALFEALARAAPRSGERIDWSPLVAQVNANRTNLRELVKAHLGELREHLTHLPECLKQQGWSEVKRRAQRIQKIMRGLGVQEAAELAGRLAKADDASGLDARDVLAQLEEDVEAIAWEVRAFIAEEIELESTQPTSTSSQNPKRPATRRIGPRGAS